jgi:ureidoglycolate dehydrogenase (NAD+)
MMFECLTSLMVANPLLEPALHGKEGAMRHRQNGLVAAIHIATFTDVEAYQAHVDTLIDGLKALPKAEGFQDVLVPGEPEDRVHAERGMQGIPLPPGTVAKLRAMAQRFGVALPPGL